MFCLICPQCKYSFVAIMYSKFFSCFILDDITQPVRILGGSYKWIIFPRQSYLTEELVPLLKWLWLDLCRVCCLFVLYHNNNHVYIVPCCVSDDHLLQTLLFHQYGLKSQSIATTFLMYVLITDNGNCQIIWVSITPILMVAKLTDILFFQNKSI